MSRILRAMAHAWRMVNPWFPMVRDHRDRPVALYRLDRRWREARSADGLPRDVFDHIRRSLLRFTKEGMGYSPRALWFLALVYAALVLWGVLRTPRSFGVEWPLLALAALAALSALSYRWRVPKAGREVYVSALLRERRCASCAYDLSQTAPAADGCTVCSECGSAWIVPVPVDRGLDPVERGFAMYLRGVTALDQGRVGEAYQLLEHSLAARPHASTALRLAEAMERLGNRVGADEMRKRAFTLGPTSNQSAMEFAALLVKRGDRDAARRVLSALLRRNDIYMPARKMLDELGGG